MAVCWPALGHQVHLWFFQRMKIHSCLTSLIIWALLAVCSPPAWADGGSAQAILLPREELTIVTRSGKFTFYVEIADEPHERSKGLMFRGAMAPNHGMLFDFEKTELVAMWMKNTPLSLDMVFIGSDGIVERIEHNTEPFSTDVITSGAPVSHVLEILAGVAVLIGLEPGNRVHHRFFMRGE